jgi:CO/xanthine dehydrogenase FAD-binding subunit
VKSPPFEYIRAGSLNEACALLDRHGADAKLLAGGQSLVPMMAFRLLRPGWMIDINEIQALKFITIEPDAVQMGGGTRQCVIARDDKLAAKLPLLRQALAWVGHIQTRNRGTVGGSLAHADPSAELPLAAQILDAQLLLRTKSGTRTVAANDFFTGPMMTTVEPQECLAEIRWPLWRERRVGSAFTEVSRRHGDFAMVAAAAQVALDDAGRCVRASFGFGGVGATPIAFPDLSQKLIGTQLDDNILRDVAQAGAAALEPGTDEHATAAYRKHLAGVLGARVLRDAREHALTRSAA